MYELIQVGEKTYYIDCPSRMGIYVPDEEHVCMIDGGSDKDAAKKALKILESRGWKLEKVFNTHSHADHIGGNVVFKQRTQCTLYAPKGEEAFVSQTVLEPALLYGAYPLRALQNKFLMAAPTQTRPIEEGLDNGMQALSLPGHSPDMTAFRTPDGVWFLGDSLVGEATLEKHGVFYLYDAEAYFKSLEAMEKLEGSWFIPSHAPAVRKIDELICKNRQKLEEILSVIERICETGKTTEEILQQVFLRFELSMDITQNVLTGAAVKACLAYLEKEKRVEFFFENCMMKWKICR